MFKGKFIDNLPKIYGTYTGGFIVFIILMAIAEQAGMSAKLIGICIDCQRPGNSNSHKNPVFLRVKIESQPL